MDKRIILVIIIAGILALLGAFAIFKLNNNNQEPTKQSIEEVIPDTNKVEEAEVVEPVEEDSEVSKNIEEQTKPQVVQPVKKVTYKKPVQNPSKVEAPLVKPLVVKEAEAELEPIQNEGVVQERNSSDIVIIKEYKTETPSHYTFK